MVNRIIFSWTLQIWYVEVRISRSISESLLEFDITRGDCIYFNPYHIRGMFSRRQMDTVFLPFFLENRLWHFMQIASCGDNAWNVKPYFLGKNKKNISKYHLLKFLPRVLTVFAFNIYCLRPRAYSLPLRQNHLKAMDWFSIGIRHGVSCINIRQVPWEVLKTEAEGRGFQHLPRDLANVNALKNRVRSLLLHKNWKHLLHVALFLALFCFAFSPMSRERNFHGLCSFLGLAVHIS